MKFLSIVLHPIFIFPWGIVIAFSTGGRYEPWQIATASIPIILQGGTDWGGSCLFAGWMANYLFFSFAAPIYAIISIPEISKVSFIKTLQSVVKKMKGYIFFFLLLGPIWIFDDTRITPNDHRNLFLFFFVYYSFLIFYVSTLVYLKVRFRIIICVIPSLILFLMMSDGVTTKAGQWNASNVDPEIHVRGIRHQLFLDWHKLCDFIFGNVKMDFYSK
ncbi:hypothetical protein MAL08_16100 [Leptospira noguchii]|uniref:hypothetical protein n=1 Tax=Leptospira noguchii TaxID=28182 RepID=UPI0003286B71|nr:hypothetical protein [Leptospira noguchii]EMS86633.1 hypothetical protein LEP1GSC073_3693 [Leptospira noguchii str. Cascata]UOG37533.1 hypothetical protein MAL08_16100 [Leptospira noguchii]